MALTKFTSATNFIQSLADKPAQSSTELKREFDKVGTLLKEYINEVLTEELDLKESNIRRIIQQNTTEINNMLNNIYPIGSIYMSVNDVNPETIFGGTWEQIKDTFLLSAGDAYSAGSTGGEANHTLTINEIPSHTHGSKTLTGAWDSNGLTSVTSANHYANTSGIVSRSTRASGYFDNTDRQEISNSYNRISINATHEHNSVGGNSSHNNMPPYLAVYMWKRIA